MVLVTQVNIYRKRRTFVVKKKKIIFSEQQNICFKRLLAAKFQTNIGLVYLTTIILKNDLKLAYYLRKKQRSNHIHNGKPKKNRNIQSKKRQVA